MEKKNLQNLVITCCYRPPGRAIKGLNSYLENVFKKANTESKLYFIVVNFNVNCLDYNENLEIRTFCSSNFVHGCIPLITRPTRVTSKTFSLIDNILTHFVFDTLLKLKKGVIKSDVSDHFPVFVSLDSLSKIHKENLEIITHKRVIHGTILTGFKTDLCNINWNSINDSPEAN